VTGCQFLRAVRKTIAMNIWRHVIMSIYYILAGAAVTALIHESFVYFTAPKTDLSAKSSRVRSESAVRVFLVALVSYYLLTLVPWFAQKIQVGGFETVAHDQTILVGNPGF
jgi:hypothetical protein